MKISLNLSIRRDSVGPKSVLPKLVTGKNLPAEQIEFPRDAMDWRVRFYSRGADLRLSLAVRQAG